MTNGLGQPARWSSLSERALLIAVTSHRLRSPVTAVRGFAETLDDHWDSLDEDRRREAVRVLRERSRELADVVDQLLSVATGPHDGLYRSAVDLRAVIAEALGVLPGALRDRVRFHHPPDPVTAYADRGSLATVVYELVTNADRHASGEIDVDTALTPDAAVVRVTDRGPGGPPDGGGASGVGLSLVREIVARQDGRVSLRPRNNGGTVAEVRMLRADVVSGGAA